MKDSVSLIQADLERAVAAHNEAVARLYVPSTGAPFYAPEVMRQEGQKARQTLTDALDNLHNRAEDIRTTAATTAAAARDDPYSWLSDNELQRAALLAPFVAEDVAAPNGATELALLANRVMAGKRKPSRPLAWLLMRAAATAEGVPSSAMRAFEAVAMPAPIAAAAATAQEAERLARAIAQARPEWTEHIVTDIVGQANYSHTGQPV